MDKTERNETIYNIGIDEVLNKLGIKFNRRGKSCNYAWDTYGDTLQIRTFKDKK